MLISASWDDGVFGHPVDHVIVDLVGNDRRQACALGAGIRFYHLPSIPITDTCIPNFARADKVVKYAQGFFYGCVEVPAVTLIQVNVVGIEPSETRFDLPCQIRAGKPDTVRRDFIFHEPVTLGRDNESVSFTLNNLPQGSLRGACSC